MGSTLKSNRSKLRTQLSQTKLYSRKWKRNSGIFVMLFLAGVFSLRCWKASTMISYAGMPYAVWDHRDKAQNPGSKPLQAVAAQQTHCEWGVNDPLLYRLHRPNKYSEAGFWYQVMESFVGRRSEFQKFFHGMYGTDVYLQEMDYAWRSRLTPMTRLLVAAGLTRSGVRSVHFVDGLHSTFSYPLDQEQKRSERVGGGVRGLAGDKLSGPLEGQTGVFRLDGHAQRSAFVVDSAEQRQQEEEQLLGDANRVVNSMSAYQDNKNSRSKSGQDGGVGGGGVPGQRGWRAGDADMVAGGRGGREGTKCVKFIADVGSWGQTDRNLWFPEDRDARDLLFALDNFCPISWLREEEAEEDGGEEDMAGNRAWGDGGRSGGQGRRNPGALTSNRVNGKKRKVIIYQRDRDRKLLKSRELARELHDRMVLLGWSVEEIVHDDLRPPCRLIDQLAGADVLLTPHGFQSILSLFLRPGSILFEIYPHKYFVEEYGPVAPKFGLRYMYSESPSLLPLTGFSQPTTEACMRWALCRWYVRRSDVEMSEDGLEILISLMLDDVRRR